MTEGRYIVPGPTLLPRVERPPWFWDYFIAEAIRLVERGRYEDPDEWDKRYTGLRTAVEWAVGIRELPEDLR